MPEIIGCVAAAFVLGVVGAPFLVATSVATEGNSRFFALGPVTAVLTTVRTRVTKNVFRSRWTVIWTWVPAFPESLARASAREASAAPSTAMSKSFFCNALQIAAGLPSMHCNRVNQQTSRETYFHYSELFSLCREKKSNPSNVVPGITDERKSLLQSWTLRHTWLSLVFLTWRPSPCHSFLQLQPHLSRNWWKWLQKWLFFRSLVLFIGEDGCWKSSSSSPARRPRVSLIFPTKTRTEKKSFSKTFQKVGDSPTLTDRPVHRHVGTAGDSRSALSPKKSRGEPSLRATRTKNGFWVVSLYILLSFSFSQQGRRPEASCLDSGDLVQHPREFGHPEWRKSWGKDNFNVGKKTSACLIFLFCRLESVAFMTNTVIGPGLLLLPYTFEKGDDIWYEEKCQNMNSVDERWSSSQFDGCCWIFADMLLCHLLLCKSCGWSSKNKQVFVVLEFFFLKRAFEQNSQRLEYVPLARLITGPAGSMIAFIFLVLSLLGQLLASIVVSAQVLLFEF